MLADTASIRDYGSALPALAAGLSAAAARLATVPAAGSGWAETTFGPVGAGYLAALAAAATDASRAAAALGERVAAAGATTSASAQRYEDAERRAGGRLIAPGA